MKYKKDRFVNDRIVRKFRNELFLLLNGIDFLVDRFCIMLLVSVGCLRGL